MGIGRIRSMYSRSLSLRFNAVDILYTLTLTTFYALNWEPHLLEWAGFGMAALWTILASTQTARDELRSYVMEVGKPVPSAYFFGGCIYLVLAAMTLRNGAWSGIPIMFLLASFLHFRYNTISKGWLNDWTLLQ